ncbi:MAG: LysR family transcriptional regulator, partial [Polaromonas sp.]|nr:LysR family transcriptional regulator [Polaromonas sp.]
ASGLGVAILPKAATLPMVKSMKLGWRPLADAWSQRRLLTATMAGQPDAGIASLVDFLSPQRAWPSQNAKPRASKRK